MLSMNMAKELFFVDSEEESEDILPKVENFAEETVPRFSDGQFKIHFRINPDTFEDFLQKLHQILPPSTEVANGRGHPVVPMEKEIMITIWCLSNLESFR